ncbi:WD domain, G-beta repeat protein, partial [Ancylostoma duodenale]
RDLKGHIMDVYKCRFFPSGLVVLSAGMDMSVRVWSVETGQCPRTFKGHTMAVTDLAIIGVGREVLSCSNDGTIIKWLCADGSEQERWRPEAGPCNAMSVDR